MYVNQSLAGQVVFKIVDFRLDEDEFATAWLPCQSLAAANRMVTKKSHEESLILITLTLPVTVLSL